MPSAPTRVFSSLIWPLLAVSPITAGLYTLLHSIKRLHPSPTPVHAELGPPALQ